VSEIGESSGREVDGSVVDGSDASAEPSPYLRIVRGHPTPAELAALVVALQSLGTEPPVPTPPAASGWAAYWRSHRQDLQPGPGVWRHSLRG
jgi:hypothetical protein